MTMEIKFSVQDAESAANERDSVLDEVMNHDIRLLEDVLRDHGLTGSVRLELHWLTEEVSCVAAFAGVRFDWSTQEAVADFRTAGGQGERNFCLSLLDVALRMEDGSLRPA